MAGKIFCFPVFFNRREIFMFEAAALRALVLSFFAGMSTLLGALIIDMIPIKGTHILLTN